MRPIVRIIDVKTNKEGKIELTKEELNDIIDQAYKAGLQDKMYDIPNNPIPPISPPTTPYTPYTPITPWYEHWTCEPINVSVSKNIEGEIQCMFL